MKKEYILALTISTIRFVASSQNCLKMHFYYYSLTIPSLNSDESQSSLKSIVILVFSYSALRSPLDIDSPLSLIFQDIDYYHIKN